MSYVAWNVKGVETRMQSGWYLKIQFLHQRKHNLSLFHTVLFGEIIDVFSYETYLCTLWAKGIVLNA